MLFARLVLELFVCFCASKNVVIRIVLMMVVFVLSIYFLVIEPAVVLLLLCQCCFVL